MGIDGRMALYMKPYNNQYFDGRESFNRLKEAVEKLCESTKGFSYEIIESTLDDDKPGTYGIGIVVPDNRNFWFQLTQLPKLLIPRFWELPADEVDKKIQELIANDAWVLENLKKLSLDMVGIIVVNELYDSSASGEYEYVVAPDNYTEASVDIKKGKKPNYANAIKHEIECVKHTAKILEKQYGETTKINKAQYWGLFN